MRLVLFALLVVTMVGTAAAIDYPVKDTSIGGQMQARYAVACAGINFDSAFYQDQDAIYGNSYDVGVGGPLSWLHYLHYGYGFAGPYTYNLFVYDFSTCTVMHEQDGLVAGNAASTPVEEFVYLCENNWCVTGEIFIGIRPMTCYEVGDCYPDIAFDYDAETPETPVSGCGGVVDLTEAPPGCYSITASGSPVDFLMDIIVDECDPLPGACCDASGACTVTLEADCLAPSIWICGTTCDPNPCVPPTATESTTWGAVKALYR